MTYQTIYSSESTFPMQASDLEELLEHARRSNAIAGVSGALVYADRMFLQILEGERSKLQALMERIVKDVRHEKVTILQEGEIPSPKFDSWKMAYVSATPQQVAKWAGIGIETGSPEADIDADPNFQRTARFVDDILALLTPGKPRDS